MKEILFKAKNEDGKWVFGLPISSVNDKCYMIIGATEDAINTNNEVDFMFVEVIPETLCQLVKNDVYVGDIVQDEDGYIYEVVFCEDDCTYRLKDESVLMIYEYWETLLVIDNVRNWKCGF
jgi:hypothetical protein